MASHDAAGACLCCHWLCAAWDVIATVLLHTLQGALAGLFALATLGTALFTYGVPLLDPPSVSTETVLSALPGTALLTAVLAAHEAGHQWVRSVAT